MPGAVITLLRLAGFKSIAEARAFLSANPRKTLYFLGFSVLEVH